jgi:hypothetical protein
MDVSRPCQSSRQVCCRSASRLVRRRLWWIGNASIQSGFRSDVPPALRAHTELLGRRRDAVPLLRVVPERRQTALQRLLREITFAENDA